MDEKTDKDLFLESLDRCAVDEDFINSFYARFMDSSEDIKDKFKRTDFSRQNTMLFRSIRVSAGATSGEPAAIRELNERARTHSRQHLNIKPEYYELWLESLIATASEYDPHWRHRVEQAWRNILGFVIKRMINSY